MGQPSERVGDLGPGVTFVFEDGVFQTDGTGARIRWTGEVLAPVGDTMRRVAASRIELEIRYDDGHVGTIEATPEHPFYVEGEGWVALGNLVTGDVLEVEGGRSAVVVGLTDVAGGDVYNFEVLGLHNYHVDDGVVVHNRCMLTGPIEPLHDHRLFPQRFRRFFSGHGITIDDLTVTLPEGMHLRGVHGRGGNGLPGRWNREWARFIATNPTTAEVYQFAGTLMDRYGLTGLPIHPWGDSLNGGSRIARIQAGVTGVDRRRPQDCGFQVGRSRRRLPS